jgi:phage N-6-adenine-methyltransferase
MSTMPIQKPGRSKQDYGTPPIFLGAVRDLLGIEQFGMDLAASDVNRVCEPYYTEEINALDPDSSWLAENWCWLNPPYADINPWVQKAYEQSQQGARIAVLVPLSIANWWVNWVHEKATVMMLHGRITFVGETKPYPKDCALLLYDLEQPRVYNVWSWKK